MADPVSIGGAASIVGSAASGILGAMGASQGAEAKAGMYQYQAGIAQLSERFAKYNSREAIKAGQHQAEQLGLKQAQQFGQIKVGQAASGLDMNFGTPVTVRENQTTANQKDQMMVRRNAAKKAYGFNVEAAGQDAQQNLYGMAAKNSIDEGKLGAISSLIGGATSVASKWTQASNSGMFATRTAPSIDQAGNYY